MSKFKVVVLNYEEKRETSSFVYLFFLPSCTAWSSGDLFNLNLNSAESSVCECVCEQVFKERDTDDTVRPRATEGIRLCVCVAT